MPASLQSIQNNYFEGNETGELSLTPRFADRDLESDDDNDLSFRRL